MDDQPSDQPGASRPKAKSGGIGGLGLQPSGTLPRGLAAGPDSLGAGGGSTAGEPTGSVKRGR